MEKVIVDNTTLVVGYHTQECRRTSLNQPIKCEAKNAWLGIGYYFWVEQEFAHYWGKDYKQRTTGKYYIYEAALDTANCINTTFDEEGNRFFRNSIDKVVKHSEKTGEKVTLEQVNRWLSDNMWNRLGVTGIIYDDLPTNRVSKKKNILQSEVC